MPSNNVTLLFVWIIKKLVYICYMILNKFLNTCVLRAVKGSLKRLKSHKNAAGNRSIMSTVRTCRGVGE